MLYDFYYILLCFLDKLHKDYPLHIKLYFNKIVYIIECVCVTIYWYMFVCVRFSRVTICGILFVF